MTTREEILEAAREAVMDRPAAYGPPKECFDRAADVWTALFKCKFTASDVCLAVAALKLVRISFDPTHKDSAVDLAGYAACQAECAE